MAANNTRAEDDQFFEEEDNILPYPYSKKYVLPYDEPVRSYFAMYGSDPSGVQPNTTFFLPKVTLDRTMDDVEEPKLIASTPKKSVETSANAKNINESIHSKTRTDVRLSQYMLDYRIPDSSGTTTWAYDKVKRAYEAKKVVETNDEGKNYVGYTSINKLTKNAGHGIKKKTPSMRFPVLDIRNHKVRREGKKSLVLIFGKGNVRNANWNRKIDGRLRKYNRRAKFMRMFNGEPAKFEWD